MRHRRRLARFESSNRPSARLAHRVRPRDSVPLRRRASLATIAGDDLAGVIDMTVATTRFSDAIDDLVRMSNLGHGSDRGEAPTGRRPPFAIIAMGKWGARELNYSSDIDLLFVHDISGDDESASRAAALALALAIVGALSARGNDGPGLLVDADLRPEGSIGPLSRPRLVCAVLRQVGRALGAPGAAQGASRHR